MCFLIYIVGLPTIYETEYVDLTEDTNTTALALIACNTRGFPPAIITWEINNFTIIRDNTGYQAMQIVTDRVSSVYKNTLIVYDVFGLLGSFTYTCTIGSSVSHDIQFTKTGTGKFDILEFHYTCDIFDMTLSLFSSVDPNVEISTSSEPVYKSLFTLSCKVHVLPKLHNQLASSITIVWETPTEILSTSGGNIAVGTQEAMINDIDGIPFLVRNLTFSSLNKSHNGVYTCQAIIQLPNESQIISRKVVYDLVVEGIYLEKMCNIYLRL